MPTKLMSFVFDETEEENYQGNDISFLTSMRIKQEQRNLEQYLKFLERQRRRSLEMYDYQIKQTGLDLEERVKVKSTRLSDLANTNGKKESIAISRRESLNVLRAHNGRTWNMATGGYHVKLKRNERNVEKKQENGTNNSLNGNNRHNQFGAIRKALLEQDKRRKNQECQPNNITFLRTVPVSRPPTRLPHLRRENTDFIVKKDLLTLRREDSMYCSLLS